MTLRLTEEELFDLTPRQFHILAERHRQNQIESELQPAMLCAILINHGAHPPKKPVTAKEFMPTLLQHEKAIAKKRRAPRVSKKQRQVVAANLSGVMQAFADFYSKGGK